MEEWSSHEMAEFSVDLLGALNVGMFVSEELQDKLSLRGIRSIDETDQQDLYWFVVTDLKTKLTKHNKPYLLLTANGISGGNFRLFCWGYNGKLDIKKYSLCVAEITKNDFGCSTNQSKLKVLNY